MNIRSLVKKTLRGRRWAKRSSHAALDDALLYRAHERAERAADLAMRSSQAAGAHAAQQRAALDAAADGVGALVQRARDARADAQRAREALEQIRLVALNAGLEGARMGETPGKPLVLVSEELKSHVRRALDALGDHGTVLDLMDGERDKVRAQVEAAQQRSADLARELLAAQAAQKDVTQALDDVGDRIKHVTRTDPETARMVAEAADHARALAASLSSLTDKPHAASLLGALAPTLAPLLELLREVARSGDDGAP